MALGGTTVRVYVIYDFKLILIYPTVVDKSLGTLLHFWGVFQFTQVQPSPHPTNNVGCIYPELFLSFNFV